MDGIQAMTDLQKRVYMLSQSQQVVLATLIMSLTDMYYEGPTGPIRARQRYLALRQAYGQELLDLAGDCFRAGVEEMQIEARLQDDANKARAGIILEPGQGGN